MDGIITIPLSAVPTALFAQRSLERLAYEPYVSQ